LGSVFHIVDKSSAPVLELVTVVFSVFIFVVLSVELIAILQIGINQVSCILLESALTGGLFYHWSSLREETLPSLQTETFIRVRYS
jgi:hypothetical protein